MRTHGKSQPTKRLMACGVQEQTGKFGTKPLHLTMAEAGKDPNKETPKHNMLILIQGQNLNWGQLFMLFEVPLSKSNCNMEIPQATTKNCTNRLLDGQRFRDQMGIFATQYMMSSDN